MAMTYATITGQITRPGSNVGIRAKITATPLTTNAALKFVGDDRMTVGPETAETSSSGTLSTLQVPTNVDLTELYWRITAEALDKVPGVPAKWTIKNAVPITGTGTVKLKDLVEIDVTAVNAQVIGNLTELVGDAEAAATTATAKATETEGWAEASASSAADADLAADTATGAASSASTSAGTASTAASTATGAATTATGAASTATTKAGEASSSATAASASATAAQTARDDAQTAKTAAEAARDQTVEISGINDVEGAMDSLLPTKISDSADPVGSALSASIEGTGAGLFSPLAGNIDATVRKLADDFADVNILVLGDSTAAQAGQFPDQLMPGVQALYPHRTLEKATWDNTGHAWGSFATVGSAGTGTHKIRFWQGAVSGTVCEQPLNYWDSWVASVQPDLVVVHYGHNYGKTAAEGGQPDDATMDLVFRERYLRFVAEVKKSCPRADVLLVSQNPYLTAGARTEISNVRAQTMREVAADLGCAYGPVLEAYLATGDAAVQATYLNPDGLHPNTSGAQLAAGALLPMFRVKDNHEIAPRNPSPFVLPGIDLLTNGDFRVLTAPPTLTGWSAINVTLSKDTTNYESANGYSVKGTVNAAGTGQAYQSLPIRRVRGRTITFAARFYVPASVSASGPGRVQLTGDGGLVAVTSGTITSVRDNFVWAFVTAKIPQAATFVTASLLFGNAAGELASVDRAVVCLGHMPRDAARRETLTTFQTQVENTEDALTAGQMVPHRDLMQVNSVSHATGTMALAFFTGDKTETINNLTVYTGSTAAAATPTLVRMGIYEIDASGNGTLVASTPNDTALFSATTTAYAKALSAPFSKVEGQRYATALLVVSGAAMATYMGPLGVSNPVAQAAASLAPMTTARLTGQTDLPAAFTAGSLVGYSQRSHMLLS